MRKLKITILTATLLLAAVTVYSQSVVNIEQPVITGESAEMQNTIHEAVKKGLVGVDFKAVSGSIKIQTWFRRQQGFYQVRLLLTASDTECDIAERFSIEDEAAAITGIKKMAEKIIKTAAQAQAQAQAQALLEKRNMLLVEGGSFQMGSTDSNDEHSVHRVTLDAFYISKYEVIQKLYKEVMGRNPSDYRFGRGDNLPVNDVTWYDAVKFCNLLSKKDGLQPIYTINGANVSMNINNDGYRLPTEAEWEYAARGGAKSRGYTFAGSNNIESVGWYWKNSGDKKLTGKWNKDKLIENNGWNHPVGQKQPNELGLYDMTGNVWEWCWDWSGNYSSSAQANPTGASSGTDRVLRGGSWSNSAAFCRSAFRYHNEPDGRSGSRGFRVVRRP